MNRVHRLNYGPDFRGHKPIQVCLLNYRDKEEILRKARLLKGSNIYISEDFSRKVREHRNELIKFMKEVKSRDPTRQEQINYRTVVDNMQGPCYPLDHGCLLPAILKIGLCSTTRNFGQILVPLL